MKPFVRIEDQFSKEAVKLRAYFDKQFENPLQGHSKRFVWDFWNVPGQYCHLRTPAYHYFPQNIYERFHLSLVEWGRVNLGCHDISPTWLSSYPEGCFQNVHVDDPHGPLAFVFSLTQNPKAFKGGRTLIAKSRDLSVLKKKRELPLPAEKAIKSPIKVDPVFNRLIVFDPSLPHGVSETKGTKDPRHARLVIHGWFVQPRAFWEGDLNVDQVQDEMDGMIDGLQERVSLDEVSGFLSLRVSIAKSGDVTKVDTLVSTLDDEKVLKDALKSAFEMKFEKSKKASTLTVPLVFRTEDFN